MALTLAAWAAFVSGKALAAGLVEVRLRNDLLFQVEPAVGALRLSCLIATGANALRLITIPFNGLICLAHSHGVSLTISRQASVFRRGKTRSPAGLSSNENGLH